MAFDSPREISVEGELPGGGKDTVNVRVAAIVPFLVMKGMALTDRLKEKDAWKGCDPSIESPDRGSLEVYCDAEGKTLALGIFILANHFAWYGQSGWAQNRDVDGNRGTPADQGQT